MLLSVFGMVLAFYLFYNYLTRPAFQICTISETINCDEVTKGTLSTLFGVPVSLVGLLGYLGILMAASLAKPKVILGFALFGTLFCLRLTILEIFVVKVICPVCIACQINMLVILFLSIVHSKKPVLNES
ncbi:hypothetical protein A3K34_01630 [candidate division WWE3 bacterium RIFOXYC1_FULL_40_10]|nr:MAG: hypothetical protein A3K58_01630 [candidate division WWE3 bacterium RIFOXYB1_FULL_40_22]OGC61566.1 MAG: hypothetical protein A3K37_01630 [candidate division WWE3 bacterium RIFOXYA1_FULL_40_11]OGC65949.1 MAG: hypothetical protein A3K34_01630 [candidate division WWE3 bacterium RIFOXYC1_FULL_40_10]OGC67098.1 MAG: hypothetical protein A2450_04440 [candidate division WWE3 bacterium RIFOXYC2_FULL_40_11]OGC71095.1 MAG: hypothetical protein A2602_01215 [candidate division WWE3 bacterium RIFOXYD